MPRHHRRMSPAHPSSVWCDSWLALESLPSAHGERADSWHGAGCVTYPTCAQWLSAEGLRPLRLGVTQLPDRESETLGITLWRSASSQWSDYSTRP